MKKVIITLIVLIILIGASGFFIYTIISDPLKVDEEIKIEINEGDTFYNVLGNLESEGKIKLLPVIKGYLKITSANLEVIPGLYTINGDMSINDILSILTGETEQDSVNITIPEGYTIEEIAAELEKNNICSAKSFLSAINEYTPPSYVNTEVPEIQIVTNRIDEIKDKEIRYCLEGYLYPDTYKIKIGTHPNEIIDMMVKRFEEVIKEVEQKTNFTLDRENGQLSRVIIRASIIEKEAKSDKDRGLISAVIMNRLEINKPLEIDATVLYAMNQHKEKTSYKDLQASSVYNTYNVYGLPPSGICNPGIKSIVAAIEPTEEALNTNKGYIYYLLEPSTNEHVFMKEDSEFEKYYNEWYAD